MTDGAFSAETIGNFAKSGTTPFRAAPAKPLTDHSDQAEGRRCFYLAFPTVVRLGCKVPTSSLLSR
jgi:hypothetical protein